jgi:hypothetical protein
MSHIPQKMIIGIQNSNGICHLTNRFAMSRIDNAHEAIGVADQIRCMDRLPMEL